MGYVVAVTSSAVILEIYILTKVACQILALQEDADWSKQIIRCIGSESISFRCASKT